ncbi:MAG: hypothetical protein LQ346_006482 [Caloplaca aetnensis]|nr:MAG: hypothetical protein LQ346_006482 [Caloplaca aetnensis]
MASPEHFGYNGNAALTLDLLSELPFLTANAEMEHDDKALGLLEELPFLTADAEDGLQPRSPMLQRIQKLPTDLSNMIMASLWEGTFCPGHVYLPAHRDYQKLRHCAPDPGAAKPTLLALSKGVFADFKHRFWGENTFVIGVGEPLDFHESGFMGWLPDEASEYVRKVHVKFSTRDLGPFCTYSLRRDHPWWEPDPWDKVDESSGSLATPQAQPTSGQLEISEGDRDWHACQMTELHKIWLEKKWALHGLRLEELTLDFLECYATDGRWIGDEVAEMMGPFRHGLPRSLTVIAQDQEMRDKIKGIVRQGYQ